MCDFQLRLLTVRSRNMTINAKPKIYLIGTGGSISFIGDSRMDYVDYSYADKHLTIEEMANNVPEINGFADVVI